MQRNVLYMNANMITALYWMCADEEKRAPFLTIKDICFLSYQMGIEMTNRNRGTLEFFPLMFDCASRTFCQGGRYFSWAMDSRIYPRPEPYDRNTDLDNKRACRQVSELLFATLGMHDGAWCKKLETIDNAKYSSAGYYEESRELEKRLGESARVREYLMTNSIGLGYNEMDIIGFNTDLMRRDEYINLMEGTKFDGPSRQTIYFYGKDIDRASMMIPRAEKQGIIDGFKEFYQGSLVFSEDFIPTQVSLSNIPAGNYDFNRTMMNRGHGRITAEDFMQAMTYAAKVFDERGYSGINRAVWRNGFKEMAGNKNEFIKAFVRLAREQRKLESAIKLGKRIYYEDGSTMEERFDELTYLRRKLQDGYKNGDEVERMY